ncbi:hypothetical protein [Burkholderia sp. SCN-KJ]|uniref:hypothetical protein n=1 Tax=Burkholderia sp. SCN-KJ TaxID=2969248 RepID=UPI0021506249|nr:hypothetical protein [Burkholderia sp. SCN-KJ]MCR4471633.1 hypothetical protein [Burkholderia sp. SCN-KJ]
MPDHYLAEMSLALQIAISVRRSPNEKRSPITGRRRCCSMARFIASKLARLPACTETTVKSRTIIVQCIRAHANQNLIDSVSGSAAR